MGGHRVPGRGGLPGLRHGPMPGAQDGGDPAAGYAAGGHRHALAVTRGLPRQTHCAGNARWRKYAAASAPRRPATPSLNSSRGRSRAPGSRMTREAAGGPGLTRGSACSGQSSTNGKSVFTCRRHQGGSTGGRRRRSRLPGQDPRVRPTRPRLRASVTGHASVRRLGGAGTARSCPAAVQRARGRIGRGTNPGSRYA
jgi:hypothetical protein